MLAILKGMESNEWQNVDSVFERYVSHSRSLVLTGVIENWDLSLFCNLFLISSGWDRNRVGPQLKNAIFNLRTVRNRMVHTWSLEMHASDTFNELHGILLALGDDRSELIEIKSRFNDGMKKKVNPAVNEITIPKNVMKKGKLQDVLESVIYNLGEANQELNSVREGLENLTMPPKFHSEPNKFSKLDRLSSTSRGWKILDTKPQMSINISENEREINP